MVPGQRKKTPPFLRHSQVGCFVVVYYVRIPCSSVNADETGWSWYIPLAGGTVSVGVVMSEEAHARKKSDLRKTNADCSASDYYLAQVQLSPSIAQFLKHAQMTSSIKSASDYSYDTSTKGGPGFRIVGDAAGVWRAQFIRASIA